MKSLILENQRGVLIFILAVLMLVCVKVQGQTAEADIIQTFKELDQRDLKIQGSWNLNNGGDYGEIYCDPQLSKVRKYLDELKDKGLLLKLGSVKYKTIKVLEYDKGAAVLLVESRYDGDYVDASTGEAFGKVGTDLLCQVELSRKGQKWKISNIVMLKDETFGT